MPIFRSNLALPRPPAEWDDALVIKADIELPKESVPLLSWLSQRWGIPVASLAADMLVAGLCGRYLLTQLIEHSRQPEQASSPFLSPVLHLAFLSPSLAVLTNNAKIQGITNQLLAGRLLVNQLVGNVNQRAVTISSPAADGDQLRTDDDSLKIWLPEGLESKVAALASLHELTKSDVIRNTLLLFVVGRIRYEQWTSEGHWRPKRKATKTELQQYLAGEVRFSRSRPSSKCDAVTDDLADALGRSAFIAEHGKSQDATRVFMPALLKRQLQQLADARRLPVSEYCRRTLVTLI
jgi:hypothetical protein